MLFGLFYNKKSTPTHAGGVVYREVNGIEEYLLVSSKRFSFIWVLPKGHIENLEAEEETALREVKEESGMKAAIIKKIANAERIRWNFKKQVTAFYLMKFLSVHSENRENRKITWLPLEKAISKLFFTDQKAILKRLQEPNVKKQSSA